MSPKHSKQANANAMPILNVSCHVLNVLVNVKVCCHTNYKLRPACEELQYCCPLC